MDHTSAETLSLGKMTVGETAWHHVQFDQRFITPTRCENYAISLLEECENLEEVEIFLQTRTPDGVTHKDANYIMAILDQRKKFVAHERFQYVLLKKFGESDAGVRIFL